MSPSPGGDVLCQKKVLGIQEQPSCRPLAGMCCVGFVVVRVEGQPGCRPLAGMCCVWSCWHDPGRSGVAVPWRGCVVSPCPDRSGGSICFRPLAGMCCVKVYTKLGVLVSLFPSPGGDVLCHGFGNLLKSRVLVSVPWRGCGVSLGRLCMCIRMKSFRPLAGLGYARTGATR